MATYIKVSISWATEIAKRVGYGPAGGLKQVAIHLVWSLSWAISDALALLVDQTNQALTDDV